MATSYVRYPDGEIIRTDAPHIFTGGEVMPRKDGEAAYIEQTRALLLTMIQPGQSIYTCIRRASTGVNGTAHISVHIIATSAEGRQYIRNITQAVATVCGMRLTKDDGYLTMGGWGYSKTFQVVYNLGRALWPNGTPEPHGVRNGEPDSDGGYALAQCEL